MAKQVNPLRVMENHSGAGIHALAQGEPHAGAGGHTLKEDAANEEPFQEQLIGNILWRTTCAGAGFLAGVACGGPTLEQSFSEQRNPMEKNPC